MAHTRACPECGKIVPWSFGEPTGKYGGRPAQLVCPEHGEFRNRAEIRALQILNQKVAE